MVDSNQDVCFNFELTSVTLAAGANTTTLSLASNVAVLSGQCRSLHDYSVVLRDQHSSNVLNFTFSMTPKSKDVPKDKYTLSAVTLNGERGTLDLRLISDYLELSEQRYKCNQLAITFPNGNTITLNGFDFFMGDLKADAGKKMKKKKPSTVRCRAQSKSNLVPIIVGAILLGVMGVGLLIYFYMRYRSRQ